MVAEAASLNLPFLAVDLSPKASSLAPHLSHLGQLSASLTGGAPKHSAQAPWLKELIGEIVAQGFDASFRSDSSGVVALCVTWAPSRFPELASGPKGRTELFMKAMRLRSEIEQSLLSN